MTGFVIVPDELNKLGIGPGAKMILAMIYTYSQKEDGSYYGTIDAMAERLNIDRSTVVRNLRSLADNGYIEKIQMVVDSHQRCGYSITGVLAEFIGCKMQPRLQNATKVAKCASAEVQNAPRGPILYNNIDNNIEINARAKEKAFDFYQFFVDLGCEPSVVKDWMIVRKEKRGVNTETAAKKIANEIAKGDLSANECITMAVEKSWCGFEWRFVTNAREKEQRIRGTQSAPIIKEQPIDNGEHRQDDGESYVRIEERHIETNRNDGTMPYHPGSPLRVIKIKTSSSR